MMNDVLDEVYAAELLARQDVLQAEVRDVINELQLPMLLSRAGEPQQIGSSVSGLMVWRDLDFNILSAGIDSERIFEVMKKYMSNPRVLKVHYHNELGQRSPSGTDEDSRYYFVMHYQSWAGHEWKIDLSFWLSDKPRTQLAYLDYLAQHVTDETRRIILWLKDIWHQEPTYPYEVSGMEVYDAVLEHGVRTSKQFDAYLRERGLPTRSQAV